MHPEGGAVLQACGLGRSCGDGFSRWGKYLRESKNKSHHGFTRMNADVKPQHRDTEARRRNKRWFDCAALRDASGEEARGGSAHHDRCQVQRRRDAVRSRGRRKARGRYPRAPVFPTFENAKGALTFWVAHKNARFRRVAHRYRRARWSPACRAFPNWNYQQ